MSGKTDRELVELYFQRDESAVGETKNKYGHYLRKIANNILGDRLQSEECENDTYLTAWNIIPPYRPTYLSVFLAKITRRLAIDLFRKNKAKKRIDSEYTRSLDELAEIISDPASVEAELEAKELGLCIDEYIRAMPQRDRMIFIKRYYYLEPIREIARTLKISEAAVRNALYRARRGLSKYLEDRGYSL